MSQPAFHEAERADQRLAELGLSWADIAFSLMGADAEARTYTRLDPPHTPGIGRWGRTNRLLRERLIPQGWSFDNPSNLPRTINPEHTFAIVATTGDQYTGLRVAGLQPTTKYAEGPATASAVASNEQWVQDGLFPQELPGEEIGQALAQTSRSGGEPHTVWLLLYHVSPGEIRSELSFPASISAKGYIDAWAERIILPPIRGEEVGLGTGGAEDNDGDDGHEDEIEVPVERR
ncbi:hypothetical protein [Nonomuraea dietziae]|uniref:hypothetical protein n=1 Tax=Nonomuraea dietziae TaxID=65515 RepID=UPI0034305D17